MICPPIMLNCKWNREIPYTVETTIRDRKNMPPSGANITKEVPHTKKEAHNLAFNCNKGHRWIKKTYSLT